MICQNCSKQVFDSAKFCNFCGTKLNQLASSNRRFVNMFIDGILSSFFVYLTSYLIGYVLGYLGLIDVNVVDDNLEIIGYVFNLSLYSVYFIIFESLWGITPAKIVTHTKVVDEFGNKPTFSAIFKRTLIRSVPFDALSFFGNFPVGWHDKWSHTRVVKK